MGKHIRLTVAAALLCMMSSVTAPAAHAGDRKPKDGVQPAVFQAAGPTASSIQSSVDQYRATLGDPLNANEPGPLSEGRREINWDGGGSTDTALAPTPFTGFLVTRGALFTTPGTGFVQATPAGLATTFGNATYETIFSTFSAPRLFSPIDSNVTEVQFFVPGGGDVPATTTGFGAVFTDVDRPDGSGRGKKDEKHEEKDEKCDGSTLIEYFGTDGKLLFRSFVPSSPGDGSLSFFGIVFEDALIARVRITTGDVAPGPMDDRKNDIVVMDDFIFGEPQP